MGILDFLKSLLPSPQITVQPLPKVNTPKTCALLFDISHHNGTVNFKAFQDAQYAGCIIKFSEGLTTRDPMAATYYDQASAFKRGAYHFFHPSSDVNIQFTNFCQAIGSRTFELIPVVDWEVHDKANAQQEFDALKKFLDLVEGKFGCKPMIYTGKWYLDELGASLPEWLKDYPLWLSWYSSRPIPKIQPWGDWTLLQWTGDKYIAQFGGSYDLNRMQSMDMTPILLKKA